MTSRMHSFLLTTVLCSTLAMAGPIPEWVVRSNRLAEAVQQDQGLFFPEGATDIGTAGFDTNVIDLAPHVYGRAFARQTSWPWEFSYMPPVAPTTFWRSTICCAAK